MSNGKVNTFGKLGKLITKRKTAIIAVWILLLAIVLPIVLTATGVNGLQMGAATGNNLESVKANDLITAQFQKTVSNDSLVIVISTNNASSLDTQNFINDLITQINDSSTIKGLENITSVYSVLVPALNQTNQGVYFAYNNGNLTYNLLYGVPTIYSNVWYQAYNTTLNTQLVPGLNQTAQGVYMALDNANQTYQLLYSVPAIYTGVWQAAYGQAHDQLVSGLNQTNQGAYISLDNANMTSQLLYSTPAIYLNAWQTAYSQTSNINQSNQIAYNQTALTLQAADPASYAQYTSQLLTAFNATWVQSFQDNSTNTWTPVDRASYASNQTNQLYINTFLAGNATNQAFVSGLTNAFTFQNFLTNTQTQNNAILTNFAIQTVVASSNGASSSQFVTAAYNLGRNPTATALGTLADTIIMNPDTYNMGTNFVSTFDSAAYNQTASMLSQADPVSYAQYTSPLLHAFNATWASTFQNPTTATLPVDVRASLASNMTNQQYINNFLGSDPATKAFTTALTNTFSLNSFLTNTQTQNNQQLTNFAIQYVANQSDASVAFVTAAYNLGRTPTASALTTLGNNVIWNSHDYGMDSFVSMFNSISYNETESILKDADLSAYNDYTSHLLNYFNTEWTSRVPTSPTQVDSWVNQTASTASNLANREFIDAYMSNSTDNLNFANAVAETFTLQDFLNGNTTSSNSKLQNFAVSYVSNSSGLSKELIGAIFNMGENCTQNSLQTLASNIVWNPDSYNVGQEFNSLLTGFVSPNKDVTLVSLSFSNPATVTSLPSVVPSLQCLHKATTESTLSKSPAKTP